MIVRRFAMVSVLLGVFLGMLVCEERKEVTPETVSSSARLIGLHFTGQEIDSMLDEVSHNLESYEKLRGIPLENRVPPALFFDPIASGATVPALHEKFEPAGSGSVHLPEDRSELAFYSVGQLSALIREGELSSQELTELYLERLKKYGPKLNCVITLTEESALEEAARADSEMAMGMYRGPLHGIPYGIKDLFAVRGYKTMWGAMPYRDQMIGEDATVVEKLRQAGAVLVAKLSLGALAWGDVWFGGKTLNPWNLEQGSSGSSAGSAAATAAGLVAFSIGTETWGSIVSPSARCGVTGLRPTFGRVSRAGAMALSWSMDKVGPICRSVEDCALVFHAISGPDGIDRTVVDLPIEYASSVEPASVRIGYVKKLFEEDYEGRERDLATLEKLRTLGFELVPIELPDYPVEALSFVLSAEAAAAFDELTRSGRDDLMVRQIKNAWPNVFRASRLIPAVEYIQANRVRTLLVREMEKLPVDVYIAPSFGGSNLLLTNLTGHPWVVLPNGFDGNSTPGSISFIGRLYEEGRLLAVARLYQEATDFHLRRPEGFE